MNVVDSLIITLGLDPSGFTKGQKDAAAAQAKLTQDSVAKAKKIEDANAKAGESVAALGRKFLGLYVLLTAGRGVKEFVSDITAADAALGRTAKNLDMSGRNLSAWQNAATVAGGSAEGITGTLRGLTSEMQRAALTGQSSIIPVFRALGINLADAKGKARDAGDVLVDLNRKAQGMDPARFTELAHMAGIDDGTIALLEKTTAEFDKLRAEQVKYAATAEDIDAAQKRQSGWRQLLITSTSLGRTILTALTPALTAAMQGVQRWADANQNFIKTKIVEYAQAFAGWIKSVDWASVGTQLATIATNVGSVAAALAKAVVGVDGSSNLYKAFEAFGLLAGVTLVGQFASLAKAITSIGAVVLPRWFVRMAGLAGIAIGGAEVMSEADKRTTAAIPKESTGEAVARFFDPAVGDMIYGRRDVNGDREEGTEAGKKDAPTGLAGVWAKLKSAMGFGDDPRTRDAISDTAKATGEMRDLMKAQKDGLGGAFGGVTESSGGLGGSGRHVGGTGSAGGGGSSPGASLGDHARGGIGRGAAAMAPNARESFEFWKSKGLTPEQAAGLAGMEQGESGFNPRAIGDHGQAHGAFQWHADRRAEILAGTGIDIDTATHKQQLEAAYWEFQHKEAGAWARIKQGRTATDAARAGVTYFERPADKVGQSIVRGGMAEGWLKRFNEEDARAKSAPAGAGTPAPSDKAITDAEVFAARQRILNGSRDPKDRALVERYKAQQASPAPDHAAPTVGHAIHHVLKVMAQARKLTHHNDNKPVAVTYVDKNGVAPSGNPLADLHRWRFDYAARHPHAAALDRMTRMAAAGGGPSVHHTVNHMDTRIGEMNVHPKGDGRQFAGEFHGMVSDRARRGDVVQANGALA